MHEKQWTMIITYTQFHRFTHMHIAYITSWMDVLAFWYPKHLDLKSLFPIRKDDDDIPKSDHLDKMKMNLF